MIPVFCHLGPIPVYSYGVLSACALGLAAFLAARRARAFGCEPGRAIDAVFWMFIWGIAGARVFFVVQNRHLYAGSWLSTLDLREGGLVWYGGFFGGVLAAWIAARRWAWSVWRFGDFVAPLLAAAHAVGRIGCFLNGCCGGIQGFPVQLAESSLLAALSVFLWRRTGRVRREGDLFLLYVLIYCTARFGLEFLREGQERYGFLTLPQIIAAALLAAAGWAWRVRHGRRNV